MIKSISVRELRPNISKVINNIHERFDRYIVNRRGKPEVVMLSLEDYEKTQIAQQKFGIFASMKGDGWKADLPMIKQELQPGLEYILDKDDTDPIIKELQTAVKKANRKLLKVVKKAEKETIETLGGVEGLLEKLYEREPLMNPDYVAPELPEKLPAPEEK